MAQDLKMIYQHYDAIKGIKPAVVRASGKKYVISINNDSAFQKINEYIITAVEAGEKNVVIQLKKGVYHFKQNHILIRGIDKPEASITIEGNGSVIIPEGKCYSSTETLGNVSICKYAKLLSRESVFICDNGDILDVWTPMGQSSDIINIESNQLAIITTDYDGHVYNNSYIRIPHWYFSGEYPIIGTSERGVIRFSAGSEKGFRVDYRGRIVLNYDNTVSNEPVRYQCFNVENEEVPYSDGESLFFPAEYNSVYECEAGHFILISSSNLKQFNVNGLNCIGAQGDGHYINLSNVRAKRISFTNCLFKGLKANVLMLKNTDNVLFDKNVVEDCFAYGVFSSNGCKNTVISRSSFKNNGLNMTQHRCIYCGGENYHIYKNKICDFTYAAIFVGVHCSSDREGPSNGIIENNEIYYTQYYWDNYRKYTLADGGAIYITSFNDEVIIRNNYIHDYTGINGNRAIFGDTGAKNVVVYSNVIRRVPNYYAIDLYRVESADTLMPDANSGNMVFGNLIDGAYKIGGREPISCADGGNILESNPYNRFNRTSVSNSRTVSENITTTAILDRTNKRRMKRSIPTYKKLLRIIEKAEK